MKLIINMGPRDQGSKDEIDVLNKAMYDYLYLKHHVFKITEYCELPEELLNHPLRKKAMESYG